MPDTPLSRARFRLRDPVEDRESVNMQELTRELNLSALNSRPESNKEEDDDDGWAATCPNAESE